MAEKHSAQDTLATALPASYRFWADDPGVKTYQVHPDQVVSFANDKVVSRLALAIYPLLTAITRNSAGVPTSATVKWDRVLDDSPTDGAFTGTPHSTFTMLLESYAVTYPDLGVTVTVDFNIGSDGLPGDPTIVVT